MCFFFSSRRRHTRFSRDWSSDVCSSDLLRYRPGGVLKRAGHTEATVDLARLAGCCPAGLLCEIVTADKQQMARLPELERFAEEHGLLMISIADLVRYRR